MRTDREELILKDKQVKGLVSQISKKDKEISALKKEAKDLRKRLLIAESRLSPVQDSLSKMTAERSKWIRKLRRAGIDV